MSDVSDCGICSHSQGHHDRPDAGCEIRYVDNVRCYCPGYRARLSVRPRLASEMPGWIGSEPPPEVLTEDDSWDRWPV